MTIFKTEDIFFAHRVDEIWTVKDFTIVVVVVVVVYHINSIFPWLIIYLMYKKLTNLNRMKLK